MWHTFVIIVFFLMLKNNFNNEHQFVVSVLNPLKMVYEMTTTTTKIVIWANVHHAKRMENEALPIYKCEMMCHMMNISTYIKHHETICIGVIFHIVQFSWADSFLLMLNNENVRATYFHWILFSNKLLRYGTA